jgi:MYXO-CTERM domain-containing protein
MNVRFVCGILIGGALSSAVAAADQTAPWASASDETGRSATNAPAQPPNASSRGAAYPSSTAAPQPAESVPSRPARAAPKAASARHERQSAAAGASRNAEPLTSPSGAAAAAGSRTVSSADGHSADEHPWGLLGLLGLFGLLGLLRRRRSEAEFRRESYDTPHSVRS